jgi:hypothetical protein
MSDDTSNDDEKHRRTGITATSKDILRRVIPGSDDLDGNKETEVQTGSRRTETAVGSNERLDRRSFMFLSGGVATAAVTGALGGASEPAKGAEKAAPTLHGYGGRQALDGTTVPNTLSAETLTQTEENAERENAMEIPTGTLVEAELDPATVDWFVFDVNEGDPITVDYNRSNAVGVTGLVLYGPDGSFKDKTWVGTDSLTQLSHTVSETGQCHVQVLDVEDGDGSYTLTVWRKENPGNSPITKQSPYGDGPWPLPGTVQAQDFDEGGQDVAYYDTTGTIRGGEYRPDERVDIELSNDSTNDYSVGYTQAGEWLEYTVDVTSGTYDVDIRVATVLDDRQLRLSLDGETLATVDVPNTGGWYSWKTVSLSNVEFPTDGEQVLRVEFPTTGVNLNWITVEGQSPYFDTARPIPGRIQAQNFDQGGQGVAYYDASEDNKGGEYRPDERVDIELSNDSTNDYSVGYTQAGEWLEYTVDVTSGTYDLNARVATTLDNRQLDVSLGGQSLGTVEVSNTGGWYTWETVTIPDVEVTTDGLDRLRLEFARSGLNVNWIELVESQTEDDSYSTQMYGEYGYGGSA